MSKLISPRLKNSSMEFDSENAFFDIDERMIFTLSHLLGWDESRDYVDLLRQDSDGNLLVSTGGASAENANPSRASITTSGDLIVALRSNRKSLSIKNIGSETIYISSDSGVAIATGYPLEVNSVYSLDNFYGSLYGISPTTTNSVAVMEIY